jgi:hypothetical protein
MKPNANLQRKQFSVILALQVMKKSYFAEVNLSHDHNNRHRPKLVS